MKTSKIILCTLVVLIVLCWPTGVCGFDLNQDPWYYTLDETVTLQIGTVLRTRVIEASTGDEAIVNFRLKAAKKPMEFVVNPVNGIVKHTSIDCTHTCWYYQAELVKNCKQLQIITL